MNTQIATLATAWVRQPALGQRPARTLLAGAAVLSASRRFGTLAFDLRAHSTTITDDPDETLAWLADALRDPPGHLLLWRAEDIVVPSLIATAESARETLTGATLLRGLNVLFSAEVTDVAQPYGGAGATSFDAVAHEHGVPFVPMSQRALSDAHRTGCHGAIRKHLAARAKGTWRLWLKSRDDAESLIRDTDTWVQTADAEVRL